MPWAVVAAGVTAGAGIYSANQSKKASNNASAANDALAQQQFEEDKRRYDLNREDQERWGMMDINGQETMDLRNRAETEKYDTLNREDKERAYQRGYDLNKSNIDRGGQAGNQLAYRMGLGGTGTGVAGGLNERYKDFNFNFEADPGYQFRMDEGQSGVNNKMAASGSLLSGAAMKALTRFNQDYASNEYGNSYGRARSSYESDRGNFNANNMDEYNRLAGMQASGQNAINSTNGLGSTVQGNGYTGSSSGGGGGAGLAGASAQFAKSSDNYYNNLMSNNNANANAQSAYNNAFSNSIGAGLGTVTGSWNNYKNKTSNSNYSYPTQNSGGYEYLDF